MARDVAGVLPAKIVPVSGDFLEPGGSSNVSMGI
jgi:hypothetical protein